MVVMVNLLYGEESLDVMESSIEIDSHRPIQEGGRGQSACQVFILFGLLQMCEFVRQAIRLLLADALNTSAHQGRRRDQ